VLNEYPNFGEISKLPPSGGAFTTTYARANDTYFPTAESSLKQYDCPGVNEKVRIA
jgi:hypothetical protein